MPPRQPANRRKFQRVTINAALGVLYCLTDQGPDEIALPPLVSEDVSPEGIFLRTTREFPLGTQVVLKLHLPTMTRPFTCLSKVVRVERRGNGEIRGVGLQFMELPDTQRQLLVEHLYRSYHTQQPHD